MTLPDENLEMLLSLALDGELSAAQRRTLDDALSADAGLRAEWERYKRLSRLLAGFRVPNPTVDLSGLMSRISTEIHKEAECDLDDMGLDALLRKVASPMPEVDWEKLSHRISARVHREAATRPTSLSRWRGKANWLARVAVPLAAAAVIAIAMWRPRQETPGGKGPIRPSVFVSFDKSPPHDYVAPTAPTEGSGIAIGPPHQDVNELPIDPAMLP